MNSLWESVARTGWHGRWTTWRSALSFSCLDLNHYMYSVFTPGASEETVTLLFGVRESYLETGICGCSVSSSRILDDERK